VEPGLGMGAGFPIRNFLQSKASRQPWNANSSFKVKENLRKRSTPAAQGPTVFSFQHSARRGSPRFGLASGATFIAYETVARTAGRCRSP